jgi:hypothetical protein
MDINKLIKLAKSYDTVGLYHEADQIMMKLAEDISNKISFQPSNFYIFYKFKWNNQDKQDTISLPGLFIIPKELTGPEVMPYKRWNYYSGIIIDIAKSVNGKKSLPIDIYNRIKKLEIALDGQDITEKYQIFSTLENMKKMYGDDVYSIKYNSYTPPTSPSGSPTTPPTTPKPGFVQGVTKLGDVFKAAKFNNYAIGEIDNIIIPDKKAYDDLLAKIQAATKPEGLNELKSNLATYGLSITSEDNTYTIRANTSGSAASQAKPLAAPKNQVQMSHPIVDVNVQEYNLNRQKKQETNQDALRSEWNGYIQGDSFLQSLESRLKDIHNQVNPTSRSEVFNDGMIATIEASSQGLQYKPLIDMYRARKEKTYQNVGDLGPAQMYGTK